MHSPFIKSEPLSKYKLMLQEQKLLSHVRTFLLVLHFFGCVYQISSLEEPHITTKRMKTENIPEDMETENTNGNEENVGTDKGILKGGV